VAGMPLGHADGRQPGHGHPPRSSSGTASPRPHELILRALAVEGGPSPSNGRWNQLPFVNVWAPADPAAPPAGVDPRGWAATSNVAFSAAQHDHSYCMLSFFGSQVGKRIMDGFWGVLRRRGPRPQTPTGRGFAQMVCVAETDAAAEKLFAKHMLYFFDKCLHVPDQVVGVRPATRDYESLARGVPERPRR